MTVRGQDLGNPSQNTTNVATVTVTVHRNLNDPLITGLNDATISRDAGDGTLIDQFTLQDADDRVGVKLYCM